MLLGDTNPELGDTALLSQIDKLFDRLAEYIETPRPILGSFEPNIHGSELHKYIPMVLDWIGGNRGIWTEELARLDAAAAPDYPRKEEIEGEGQSVESTLQMLDAVFRFQTAELRSTLIKQKKSNDIGRQVSLEHGHH